MNTPSNTAQNEVKVWDPLVRIFHWSLVAFFAIAYLTGEEESSFHNIAGYVVLALIGIRLLWGFVGTRHARFGDFIYGPGTVLRYARDLLAGRANRYLGHNPLGGIMVVALLISISATGVSGWALQRAEDAEHPAAAPAASLVALSPIAPAYADGHEEEDEHESGESVLEETHEFFANLTLLLIFLHVAGVITASLLHRENLVRAMFTGRKSV